MNNEILKALKTIKEYCKDTYCTSCCIRKTCDKYICQEENSFAIVPAKWRVLDPEEYSISTLVDNEYLFIYAENNAVRTTQETEYTGDERYYFHFNTQDEMDAFLKDTDLMSGIVETPVKYETIKEYRNHKWNL